MLRNLVRLTVAVAVAVTTGFTWTVGQSGLRQTNSNLCDLWKSLPLPSYPSCEFQYVLPLVWGLVFFLALGWAFFELVKLIRKLDGRGPRLLSYLVLGGLLQIGAIASIVFFAMEYRRPPQHAAQASEVIPAPASAAEAPKPYEINLARELLFFVNYSLEATLHNIGGATNAPPPIREEPFVIQTVDDDAELQKIVAEIEHDHAWQISPGLKNAYTEISIISRHAKDDFAFWKRANPNGYAKTLNDRVKRWRDQIHGFNGILAFYAQYSGNEGYEDLNRRKTRTNLNGWGK